MKEDRIEDIYELSPMQQGMLFHSLYAPQSGLYVTQLIWSLQGDLNVPALERAWQQAMDRHSVLRASFHWEELDKPLQVVHRCVKLPVERHDWRGLSSTEQTARLRHLLQTDRTVGFDLSTAPLMRLTLIRVAEDGYRFVWTHHHLLLDGWSVSLLLKEVWAFYEAFSQGRNIFLERNRPYGDYIEWLQQQDLARAEIFWRGALKGFTAPTPLVVARDPGSAGGYPAKPGERSRVGEDEAHGEEQIRLSMATTAALRSLGRQHQLTLNTIVQGAWALLLSRYSGEDDVMFGLTVSGRSAALAGIQSMVGLFINTLPLRIQTPADASLLPWLKALQSRQFDLLEYECSPLVQVQGWSEVPRDQPLFESILVFGDRPPEDASRRSSGSLQIQEVRTIERTNFPLAVSVTPGPELRLRITYECRRFDGATIMRMLGHFHTLLQGIVEHADEPISTLPLLTAAERHQLLVEWNQIAVEYPRDRCVHQLFEEQVERTPDAVAVVTGLKADLYHGYGPTEATVAATFWRCRRDSAARTVPIGRPIANTQIYLLDSHRQPVPIGVPGELYVGGDGLAQGYLNQPELIAEQFISHPFSDRLGARLYKTGDRARWLPDGNLEFLGRLDHQVKSRGFRIELGEIEATLGQHPALREAVVLAREDQPGDQRLVAYLVPHDRESPPDPELRRFLRAQLPEQMIPAAFVRLPALPLTPNGKVDRRALPVPEPSRPELDTAFVAPRGPIEEMLAAIWAEVLGLEQVGVHDDFFALGGHSLLATQVIVRVRSTFQVEVPLRRLFEVPTIAGLATAVTQSLGRRSERQTAHLLAMLEQFPEEGFPACLPEQER